MGLSPEEEKEARGNYNWSLVPRDLALTTHLTLYEAIDICRPLEDLKLDPYDAYPLLKEMLVADKDDQYQVVGYRLASLLRLLDLDSRIEELRKVQQKWKSTRYYELAANQLVNDFVYDLEKILG